FSGIDTGSDNCGPRGADGCRGADSSEELARQLAKVSTALAVMDADIVGLVELENNADGSLPIIVDALNDHLGTTTYDFVDTGTVGNDAIRTGLIYKAATVIPDGGFAVLDNAIDDRFNDARNRPVLAQSFRELSSDAILTVAVAHLKSKGSDCIAEGDPNTGDGQGNCNQTRSNAALAMADWLRSDPTNSGDPDILLLGDLNAYLQEDPVAALRAPGLVNLLDAAAGAPYSFVFDGQSGALDHAIASTPLQSQVVGVLEWHINADESPLHDYNLEHGRDPGLFDPASPYRSSDHDPVIVGIDLN
ncbi:MAG: ExeM/NucH family extracellular endonuclease, partial [Gammaproteobacteria bacterium]|nr:ExeM/NucH family extracellular endonuclease [Gammaproteobacteria bacterium]